MTRTITIFHGTSADNARKIEKEGFKINSHNWRVKSKEGFIYFSTAYAPFYAMHTNSKELALIKVKIKEKDLYPEDDFLMYFLKKPVYSQEELDAVNFEEYKFLWRASLKYMGNVAAKPESVKIVGVTYFSDVWLLFKCDPVIAPINFQIMGDYYNQLTEWLFDGKKSDDFPSFGEKYAQILKDLNNKAGVNNEKR